MDINAIALQHWLWCEEMGWHNKTPLEYLALVGSEVGEAVNECRGEKPTPALGLELADIVLRTLDLMWEYGITPETVLRTKIMHNIAVGKKPGRIK